MIKPIKQEICLHSNHEFNRNDQQKFGRWVPHEKVVRSIELSLKVPADIDQINRIDSNLTNPIEIGIPFLIRILYINYDVSAGGGRGEYYIIFLLVVTKFSDMGAYLIGTLIGKNKMIPHISPGKTWEGFIFGCLTFAVGGGCLIFYLFKDEMPLLEWRAVVILSFCLAVIAALGDLAESILKRSLAVKDSGNILPGIGGVLDLLDSVLFTAPVLFIYLTLLS